MNEFKTKTIQYCHHFQEGKFRFGEKCRYQHKINPDYRRKEVENDERKKSNNIITNKNNNKFQYKKKISNTQNINTTNCQNRNDNIEGKPPKYSNQRHLPIKNMKINNVNSEDQILNDNNSNWLFNKSSSSSDINPRMYVLKRTADSVKLPDKDDFNHDAVNFDRKYENSYIPLLDEEFKFTDYQQHQSDVLIHEFLEKNVSGMIIYNADQFFIRTTFGYAST